MAMHGADWRGVVRCGAAGRGPVRLGKGAGNSPVCGVLQIGVWPIKDGRCTEWLGDARLGRARSGLERQGNAWIGRAWSGSARQWPERASTLEQYMNAVTEKFDATNGGAATIDASQPYRVAVQLTGTADLLFHRWNSQAVDEKAKAAKNSKAKKTDDIESYVYRNDDGHLCIPGEYVRQAVVMAAKFRQDPRSPGLRGHPPCCDSACWREPHPARAQARLEGRV